MIKKSIFLLCGLFLFAVLASGCGTAPGLVRGTQEVGKGVTDDAKNGWAAAKKADNWMRENLW